MTQGDAIGSTLMSLNRQAYTYGMRPLLRWMALRRNCKRKGIKNQAFGAVLPRWMVSGLVVILLDPESDALAGFSLFKTITGRKAGTIFKNNRLRNPNLAPHGEIQR